MYLSNAVGRGSFRRSMARKAIIVFWNTLYLHFDDGMNDRSVGEKPFPCYHLTQE